MNKKIENIAKIVLTDDEYILLNKYLSNKQLNSARLFIDEILTDKELTLDLIDNYNERSDIITEIQNLDTILDEIFNLYEEEDEREQIKSTT